jgi:hypothetical protein
VICAGHDDGYGDRAASIRAYDNGYYQEKLEEGLRYQDYVTDVLYEHGIVLVTYVSKERGRSGENKLGAEVKRDGKFRVTGNLYLETHEKRHPNDVGIYESGIYRQDNSWLYVIGDETTFWILSKKLLCEFARQRPCRFRSIETPSSRGLLMPLADADRWCALKFEPGLQGGGTP